MKLLYCALLALMLSAPQQRPLSDIATDLERIAAELRTRPTTTAVHTSADFATAAAAAKAGDVLLLDPGVRYVLGGYMLGAKAGVVTIRSSATLPERRITPADAPLLPILASGDNGPVINGQGAAHWKFDGVQFEPTANGAGEVVVLQDALDVTFDRILIVGGVNGQKRGIRGNGQQITLTRSSIANIWAYGQDSQAFCAWDGAGPYTLVDNYLEAASENVMFGGADSLSADRIPSDILVEGNTFTKPDTWRGQGKAVKNLFELKVGKRVIVRNNYFSNVWTDAQNGYALLVKSVDQGGKAPWSVTEDVLFENNEVHNAANGINILGADYAQPSGLTTRIVFRRNLIETTGTGIQIGGGGEITFDHNTFKNGYTFLSLYGPKIDLLTVTNNIANHNDYGVKGDGVGIGLSALTTFTVQYVFSQNLLLNRVPGHGGSYPPDNWFIVADVPTGVVVGR
jgi:hypothetical protein